VFYCVSGWEFFFLYPTYKIPGPFISRGNFVNFVVKECSFGSPGSLSKLRLHKPVARSSIDIKVLLALVIPPLFGLFINSEFFRETTPIFKMCWQ